jgi:uncharacterized protein YggE
MAAAKKQRSRAGGSPPAQLTAETGEDKIMTAAQSIEGVAVVGEAVRRVPPESAEFLIEVDTTAYSAAQAMKEHQSRAGQIAQAVAHLGVQKSDLQTISLNVANLFAPMAPALPPPFAFGSDVQLGSYQVRNVLRVTVREPGRVGEVVDALTKAGAMLVGGFSLRVSDEAGARKAALEDAARDARTKAESLAAAAGKQVGDPQAIVEDVVASNGAYAAMRAHAYAGELEYYARVTASFRFQ